MVPLFTHVFRSNPNAVLKEFCGNAEENGPKHNLKLLCNPIMSAFLYANLAGNVGSEGHIQIYQFFNIIALIVAFGERWNTVKLGTQKSESVVVKITWNLIV